MDTYRPTYDSLSKSEQVIVTEIWWPWSIDLERVAEIFITYEKNVNATKAAVAREAFYRILTRKGD